MNIQVGKKIKDLRSAKNITQSELAKRIGVTTSTVSSYEVSERHPSYDVLIKIATFFNVTTDFLLGIGSKDVIDITGLGVKQRTIVNDMINSFKEINYHRNQEPNMSVFWGGVGSEE